MMVPQCLLLFVAVCISLCTSSNGVAAADHTLIYVSQSSVVHDSTCWTGGLVKPCSSLDLALEGVHNLSNSIPPAWVVLLPGEYPLNSMQHSTFGTQIRDFGIIANDATIMPTISCGEDVGFSFINVSGITLQNVIFNECGSIQPSTSSKRNSNVTKFWEFRIGLYFVNCSDIWFEHTWVNNTRGIGAFLFSSYGNNSFHNSRFHGNSAIKNEDYPAGGGLYVEYSSCIPTSATVCIHLTQYSYSTLDINNCTFENNSGEVLEIISTADNWLLPTGSGHSSIGRGGGLSITIEGESKNINVSITETTFKGNKALFGGGLFVEFHDNASHNILNVQDTSFINNSVKVHKKIDSGGGGVRVGLIFYQPSHVLNNSITFNYCKFMSNKAKWGGGVSFYAARERNVLVPSNTLSFNWCTWSNNTAWLGAAVDLDLWDASSVGHSVVVNFYHSNVYNNSVMRANWTLMGAAAFYIDTVPIKFSGISSFVQNSGSALVASGSSITLEESAVLLFKENNGRNGGAIQLVGNSFITVGDSFIYFSDNTAEQKGGAIFVQTVSKHDLITTSPNCFIRYENITVPPKDWESIFFFIKNKANGKNNSIYMTTTAPCEWHDGPNTTSGSNGTALCWNNWSYLDDNGVADNCRHQIETDPEEFTTNSLVIDKRWIIPGMQSTLSDNFHVVDDFGNNATDRLVLTASIRETITYNYTGGNNSTSKVIEPHAFIQPYIANNTFTMYGKTNNTYIVELYTMDPRVVYTTMQVELLPCPFGFVNNVHQDKHFSCECDNSKASFNGIVECSRVNFTSHLNLLGQWAGLNQRTGHRVAGSSPYTKNLNRTQLTLPPINETLNPGDYFCKPENRMDVLCGKCRNGTGPSINSENYKCVECLPGIQYYSWLLYIGTEILPLTIFFLVLILFNVSLTSGAANAFIFFSQIITTTFGIYTSSSGPYHAMREAYRLVYGIWNLDIFSSLPFFQYCLNPNLDTITVILLEYIIAFYPLLVIIILYSIVALYNRGLRPITWLCTPVRLCFIRLRNVWNPRNSLIDAIAAFILLSYSRMVQTSLKLLRYSTLVHENGSFESRVVYYDGTMPAYEGKHIIFVVIAVFVLLVFVVTPPLVLILYPLKVFHRLTSVCCSWSGGRFEQFLNAFYGSFKDGAKEGKKDYRFFAGLYLLYRGVFAVIRFVPINWALTYLLQNIFCLLAIIMFTTLRPYRNDLHNTFDACIFALLLLVSLLNQFNFNQVYLESDQQVSPVIFSLEYILIWVPFVVVVCLLIYWMCKSYVKKIKKQFQRTQALEATLSHVDIMPRASSVDDDNSIMRLMDERPMMYNYGSVNTSPIPSSDTEGSVEGGGKSSSNQSHRTVSSKGSSKSDTPIL